MNFYAIEISQTAVSNAWSFNSQDIAGGICYQIYVKAGTPGTTFDFTLTDGKSNLIYDTEETGETATTVLNKPVQIPMKGKYTLAVANSSAATDTFTGRLLIRE